MKNISSNIRFKLVKDGVIFLGVLIIVSLILVNAVNNWHDRTVAKNSGYCEVFAREIQMNSKDAINTIGSRGLFNYKVIPSVQLEYIDSVLAAITSEHLSENKGLEGGFYFGEADEFLGYSYPTSSEPKPVYGPPPRSYNIIREQCRKTIVATRSVMDLHGFDPAVFPLMTVPVWYQKQVIGAVWVRIHIERELPLIKLQNVINVVAVFLVIVLVLVLWFFYRFRTDVQSIRDELGKTLYDPEYKLRRRGKFFGEIVNSINLTLEKLHVGNQERRLLEHKLLQREKMASIGRIVAGVAHEVRTPLAIIKTRVQMWQHYFIDNQQAKAYENVITESSMDLVVKETDRLSNLIKRLLIYSRPIHKKLSPVNLQVLITEVVNILQIKKANSTIKFEIESEDVQDIELDVSSIQQVFLNVLSNSMEAMPTGGVIIVKIRKLLPDQKVEIKIVDEGNGITNDVFDKVFEPFVTTKTKGVGLGLSISKEIINAHYGQMYFTNGQAKGAICTILLPVIQDE